MRLPVENALNRWGRRHARGLIVLSLAGPLAACGMMGGGDDRGGLVAVAAMPVNGPQADYPVLVGEPYQIGTASYRPNDTLNYDEVGYLAEDSGVGITGSHHTLPVPSYAEVTSLATGRTILVRLERRGPMASNHLLALSPAALAQLDATGETPVRVRRVNPPEDQRALLRAGQNASLRMDTPMALVSVLRRRLPAFPVVADAALPNFSPAASVSRPEHAVGQPETVASLALPPLDNDAPLPQVVNSGIATPSARVEAPSERFMVQAAAFSTEDRAQRAAGALGGVVSPSGRFFRVRTGPFLSRTDAEASLANVRAAGYSDARILTDG